MDPASAASSTAATDVLANLSRCSLSLPTWPCTSINCSIAGGSKQLDQEGACHHSMLCTSNSTPHVSRLSNTDLCEMPMCCRVSGTLVPAAMLHPSRSSARRCQGQLSQRRSAAAAPRPRSAAPSAYWPGAALTCLPHQPRLLNWRSPCHSFHPACRPHQLTSAQPFSA